MKINQAGIDLIKRFEGIRLKAYRCPAGVFTIGYGHTGPDVHEGMTITDDQAEDLLRSDVERFEQGISTSLGGSPTTDNQFAAMVSMAYNVGLGAFKSSSVLRYHREKNTSRAADSFRLWIMVKGKPSKGLQNRREAERDLYLKA